MSWIERRKKFVIFPVIFTKSQHVGVIVFEQKKNDYNHWLALINKKSKEIYAKTNECVVKI